MKKKSFLWLIIAVSVGVCGYVYLTRGKPAPPEPSVVAPITVSVDADVVDTATVALHSTLSAERIRSQVTLWNLTDADVVVYFAFGADSVVLPANWPFCPSSVRLTCQFTLPANGTQVLPLGGQYLNTTFAFGSTVSCGSTKAELNVNNPKWYDIADISLVDGYSNKIQISIDGTKLGPPNGASGNEKVLGVFPLGCDICTARQRPPCGMQPGSDGCKSGTQYKPDVPCQYQGKVMGGGSTINVSYLGN